MKFSIIVFCSSYDSENTYVRVTGNLKMFGSKRYINAQHIRPSTDPHEFYFHLGEALTTDLMITRGMVSIISSSAICPDILPSRLGLGS